MTKKYQIGLDEQTLNLVRQASGKDGMGGYVHSLVTQRHDQWTTALNWLQENGWGTDEIAAACRLLEDNPLVPDRSLTEQVADNISAGYRTDPSGKGISEERWQELIQQVRTTEPAAVHLSVLTDELLNDNQELAAQLGLADE